jgi:hypothetical protein
MLRLFLLGLVSLLVLTGGNGCKKWFLTKGDSAMTVFPEGASPGMLIRVTGERAIFSAGQDTKVEIGGAAAPISRVVSDTEAEVMVPNVGAGSTTLTVGDEKERDRNSAHFTVLPAPTHELVLHWKDGRIDLVAVHATAGEPTRSSENTDEPLLAFDVFNAAGGLIYTGAIPHPGQQRMEVFDPPDGQTGNIHREHVMGEATFALKVPTAPGRTTIKFFEVPAGTDLSDARARASRKPVGEIEVKGEAR